MKDETLKQLLSYVEQTSEFAKEQAPLVAQEILNVGYINCSMWSVIITLCFAGCFVLLLIFNDLKKEKAKDADIAAALSFLLFAFSSIALLVNIYCWLYVLLCPRLYILSSIKSLLH
jgi:hypothetical protein